ncbi:ABC transporter substrate-binding protein [Parvibaculum sp.]|uniref:ABC transporter substrate-binding protein n=1 Tax=Parvibaculum sp. TaxID=2024848 RepID=UPI003C765A75
MRLLPLSILLGAICWAFAAAAEAPRSIVSINLCSDIYAADIAAPGTLKSVFRLGQDAADSPVAEKLRGLPRNDARIEEILPFAPDLVLAHEWTSPFTLDLLHRVNIPFVLVKDSRSFEDIRANIRLVAKALGREARGAEIVAAFDAELEKARRNAANGPTAILYQDMGSAATPDSVLGRILTLTGFRNVIAHENPVGLVYPGIEDVIAFRPQLIALGIYRPNEPSLAGALLAHPALHLYRKRHAEKLDLPAGDWTCNTHYVARTAALLAATHDDIMARRALASTDQERAQ